MSDPSHRRSDLSRRTFLQAGATAVTLGAAARGATPQDEPPRPVEPAPEPGAVEWRNRQPGMAYRKLGRTGMMISEVVSGGDPITPRNDRHLELVLERGLNYLDMAPSYHNGGTEEAYGRLLGGSSAKRMKVFLTTKVSGLTRRRNQMSREIFDGLPATRQEHYQARAQVFFSRAFGTPPA